MVKRKVNTKLYYSFVKHWFFEEYKITQNENLVKQGIAL